MSNDNWLAAWDAPEDFRKEVLEKLIQEKGEAWVKEHAAELLANWEAARKQLGL